MRIRIPQREAERTSPGGSLNGRLTPRTWSSWKISHPRDFPRRRQWQPTPVLLPGKSHGWRSLVGCGPWGRDMTERLHFHCSLLCIGEGNGNPLQCSCLENPRDGGTWWAAVYGVTQSRTRLKWLSSSSSSRDFPGGPAAKTPRPKAGGPSSFPDKGTRSYLSQLRVSILN